MSLFRTLPSPFPLRIDVAKRPVAYVLRVETVERVVVIVLSVMWLVLGSVFAAIGGGALAGLLSLPTELSTQLAVGAYLIVYALWFGPAVNERFRVIEVAIQETRAEVRERDLVRSVAWSHELAAFEGVMLLGIGTHLVGNKKIPLASVVLKHPDEARSVPLFIDAAQHVGRTTVERVAKELGLPALTGVTPLGHSAPLPESTIVFNRTQALKVRFLTWFFVAIGAASLAWALHEGRSAEPDHAAYVLAPLLALFALGMHVYSARYVTAMHVDGDAIIVRTAAFGAPLHRIALERLGRRTFQEGRSDVIYRQRVHAPWITLQVEGYRIPFVIDVQADFVDRNKLERLGPRGSPVPRDG